MARNNTTHQNPDEPDFKPSIQRSACRHVLKAIGREARAAHEAGDLQALVDRLDDADFYKLALGRKTEVIL
jgi:hypothetical protein